MVEPLLSDIKKSRAYREIAEEVEQELTPKIEQKVRSKQAKEIARMLLSKKMSLEFIVEVTGLSSKEARALRRELAASKN